MNGRGDHRHCLGNCPRGAVAGPAPCLAVSSTWPRRPGKRAILLFPRWLLAGAPRSGPPRVSGFAPRGSGLHGPVPPPIIHRAGKFGGPPWASPFPDCWAALGGGNGAAGRPGPFPSGPGTTRPGGDPAALEDRGPWGPRTGLGLWGLSLYGPAGFIETLWFLGRFGNAGGRGPPSDWADPGPFGPRVGPTPSHRLTGAVLVLTSSPGETSHSGGWNAAGPPDQPKPRIPDILVVTGPSCLMAQHAWAGGFRPHPDPRFPRRSEFSIPVLKTGRPGPVPPKLGTDRRRPPTGSPSRVFAQSRC